MAVEKSLRDHARDAIRDEVMKHAWSLFAEQGFEATTVEQVAASAGMSRRTFFRYFSGKDELVLERLVESGHRIADALRARPADEAAWPALRAAFQETVEVQERYADRSRPLQIMLREEPGVRSVVLERRRQWHAALCPLVAERLPSRGRTRRPDTRADAVTGSALACLEAAQEVWADHPGAQLGQLLDDAMGAVAPLS
ncbi:TetR family transcriptional regulator [Nocardioides sp. KIGAM211]|uniref:TetR family transcriptional regulator n=1 Tax=Nocardioides luti TaxID=2761101 RepID=A0A7X0RFS3_9ACTN|nr:TetR family transcriptional regulator [Nocardioides luti]MBB6627486.1 TetR family transcriptional regulator [Nocardioides luti]